MSELNKRYQEIINEIDAKLTDEENLIFIKDKISEISIIFMDIIDRMSRIMEDKIVDIENSQLTIEKRLSKLQKTIDYIEKDIYDEYSETEIICPYCNSEFLAEISDDEVSEIQCPECHNTIVLDMDSNDIEQVTYCDVNCSGCRGCKSQNINDNNDDDNKKK